MGLVSETRKKAVEYVQEATPSNPTDGQTWYDYINQEEMVYVGSISDWVRLSSLVEGSSFPGGLWGWGANNVGRLGDGTTINKSSPVKIGSLTNWKNINTSYDYHICGAIKTDGTLWTWGYNAYGQIGDNTTINKSSPIQIGSLTTWKMIKLNFDHVAAIKTDGTLWTWGYNYQGYTGDGTTINKSSPVKIGNLTTWSKIAVGVYDTLAIKTDGTLWGIGGYNYYGESGSPSRSPFSSPVQIGNLTTWKEITIGTYTTIGIKTDGTLWSWGLNDVGQMGDSTTINKSVPVNVGLLTNWKSINCVAGSIAAIKTDGTLWTWGYARNGVLGYGDGVTDGSRDKSSPCQVGLLTDWKTISTSFAFMMALKTDGTIWSWGLNSGGQLGDGTTISKSSPVKIGSLTNWKIVNIGVGII